MRLNFRCKKNRWNGVHARSRRASDCQKSFAGQPVQSGGQVIFPNALAKISRFATIRFTCKPDAFGVYVTPGIFWEQMFTFAEENAYPLRSSQREGHWPRLGTSKPEVCSSRSYAMPLAWRSRHRKFRGISDDRLLCVKKPWFFDALTPAPGGRSESAGQKTATAAIPTCCAAISQCYGRDSPISSSSWRMPFLPKDTRLPSITRQGTLIT